MTIQVVSTERGSYPQVFCDQCGARIVDAHDGNYLWLMEVDATPEPRLIYFLHKDCTHSFESTREGVWGALDLHELPVRLAANLGMPVTATPGEGFVDYELRGSVLGLSL